MRVRRGEIWCWSLKEPMLSLLSPMCLRVCAPLLRRSQKFWFYSLDWNGRARRDLVLKRRQRICSSSACILRNNTCEKSRKKQNSQASNFGGVTCVVFFRGFRTMREPDASERAEQNRSPKQQRLLS
mmetsp:Transcript_12595/g.33924  ORF Transcript_12595/g.33924 Transcript_12595/m.33924 type:complete len:127 (-) Transcript_12595:269-649(-)